MFKNIFKNILTTLAGAFAGVPEIIHGIQFNNITEIISGVGMLLLGILAKDIVFKKTNGTI